MQTNTFTEKKKIGDFLKMELDKAYNRENAILLSGQNLLAGTILGMQLVGAAAAATAFGGNTGNGAMGAIVVGTAASRGNYKLIITEPGANVGTFSVFGPDGILIGDGIVGSAFSAGGLAFTLADGATDFVAGDAFNIEVTGGTDKYGAYDPTATNGLQTAAAMLLYDVNASAADTACVVLKRGPAIIVDAANLVWGANVTTDAQKAAGLAALLKLGIVSRQTI